MAILSRLASFARRVLRGQRAEADLQEELSAHIELLASRNMGNGMDAAAARRAAALEMGGVEQVKEEVRQVRTGAWLESLLRDVGFGIRMLRRSPGFAAAAILTLALGVGANTAVYSVIDGVLLNPLPFAAPDQLVALHSRMPRFPKAGVSWPNFLDWRRQSRSFDAMAAWRNDSFIWTGRGGAAELLRGEMVSSEFFPVLRLTPVLGRVFRPEDDRLGATPVAVISESLWQRRFNGAKETLGRQLVLNGKPHTVIGVVPSRLPLISYGADPGTFDDVFTPIGQWDFKLFQDRSVYYGTRAIGRLKPGVALATAQAEMNTIAAALAAAYPKDNTRIGIGIVPLIDDVAGDLQPPLLLLLGAVALVLLIACANVANLLLARLLGRTREFAVRIALGAGRGRVIRQILIENVMLTGAGGALGVVVAGLGVQPVLRIFPSVLPPITQVGINWRVLVFAVALSIVTGIVFGLAPALRMAHEAPVDALKEGGRGVVSSRHWMQRAFVAGEVGLALTLLIGAGLLIRSFVDVWAVSPGFEPRNVLWFGVELPPATLAKPENTRVALQRVHDKLAALPGVESASFAMASLPLAGDAVVGFWPSGKPRPIDPQALYRAQIYIVSPDYFRTMKIPLLQGRGFAQHDDLSGRPVIIVDEELARGVFPGRTAIGERIDMGAGAPPVEIVGVAGHVKHWGLDREATSTVHFEIYLPYMQVPDTALPQTTHSAAALLRSTVAPESLIAPVRRAISELDPDEVVHNVHTMERTVGESLGQRRFAMAVLGIFALLALLLAGIGIYGVVSHLAGLRTREIGMRVALGAQPRDIPWIVLHLGGGMVLAGIAAGLAAAAGLTRLMTAMLFGVSALDPATFTGVTIALLVVALLACWIPAHRAMRVDPMVALRHE
jgi:predicted permease